MEIVFWGRGGQGAVTAAALLVLAASYEEKYAQASPFFGAEKRGAPVNAFLRISARPIFIHSRIYEPDCIIVLDAMLPQLVNVASGLKEGGTAILNASCSIGEVNLGANIGKIAILDATRIASSIYGHQTMPMTNMIMVGAFSRITGEVALEHVLTAIQYRFKGKIAEQNVAAAKEGYAAAEIILDRTAAI